MINCFLCPYPFLGSQYLFVNKTFNTYVSTQISKFELHTYVPGLTLLGVLVMRMTLEINQLGCFKSIFMIFYWIFVFLIIFYYLFMMQLFSRESSKLMLSRTNLLASAQSLLAQYLLYRVSDI